MTQVALLVAGAALLLNVWQMLRLRRLYRRQRDLEEDMLNLWKSRRHIKDFIAEYKKILTELDKERHPEKYPE